MSITNQTKSHLATCDLIKTNTDRVANALGMSSTTLRRKLRAEGSSFSELLEKEQQTRCSQAHRKQGRKVRAKTLATDLGYNEVGSFYRAFQRWHGVTYRSFREQLQPPTLEQ